MLVRNGLPGVNYGESESSMELGVFLRHFRGEMQEALERIFQPRDVLTGLIKLDFAVGGNAFCQQFGRSRKVKDEIGSSHGRVKVDCPVPVDSPRYVACNTSKNVAVREDNLPFAQGWPNHRFQPMPEIGSV